MTNFATVQIGELFEGVNGRAKFIRDYIAVNPGDYPVYSASLVAPFGYVNEFEFDGHFLTWVMNGYGGRVQEKSGRFSTNRDRGVFVPRLGVKIPDLTYLRFAMEPQLIAAAVGRRVDGRQNDYTKIYPDTAEEVSIQLPLDDTGQPDYIKMTQIGAKLGRIEAAQAVVRSAHQALLRAAFAIDIPEPSTTVSLGDDKLFALSIGKRILRSEHTQSGVPAYSANALVPFGLVEASNLNDFSKPSLLWGIDGNFDWNLLSPGQPFATTDHCGRLQLENDRIDPEYVYWYLKITRGRYGFDRVYRASLDNMRSEITVTLPIDLETGEFSIARQRLLAEALSRRERSRAESLSTLQDVLRARIGAEM